MRIARYIAALSMIAMPALSFAITVDGINRAPEPETLALLAGAAVAWGIVRWIRRK
jgi:hypothetical protein